MAAPGPPLGSAVKASQLYDEHDEHADAVALRSSSVHRRSTINPEGDTSKMKVRLSDLIAANTVPWMPWS